jgi:type IV pilus assembly protein PilY1
MLHHTHRALRPLALLRTTMLTALFAVSGTSFAQTISDVPPAVKNNVAPNFMFMLDNSGSMSNIVPTSPYDENATYLASCPSGNEVSTSSQVNIRIVSGEPRFRLGGSSTNYRHTSIAGSDQRCFNNSATYTAALLADSGGSYSGSYLPAAYSGHYLNWYFGNYGGAITGWTNRKVVSTGAVNTRMEIAKTAATSVVNSLPLPASVGASAPVRVGLSTYNGADGGALLRAVTDFTTTHRTNVNSSISGLSPSGMTPLSETLADIGRYFSTGITPNTTTITAGSVSGITIDTFLRQDGRNSCLSGADCISGSAHPIQHWCQKSYVFLMTDGRPQGDQAFTANTYLRDYDLDCSGANASSCSGGYDRKIAQTYESAGSGYLDDIAKALYDVDLRPDLEPPLGRTGKNNLVTYTIGFADLQVQNNPLLINAGAQGGGQFLSAQDNATLIDAFDTAITDALAKDAASAAVAVANAQITVNNIGYASSYNSGSWYGDLEAFSLDTTTGLPIGGAQWSARDELNTLTEAGRKIVSFDGTAGRAFNATNAASFSPLTSGVISYLRGIRTGEGTTYRSRSHLLGDIINAEPVVVNYTSSTPIIFQAANDGMLHVFDGRVASSATTRGQELWAYVPRLIHSGLAELSGTGYTHKYFVDGTPATAEITGAGAMTRILVGGLGKGGAGYYALDITDYNAASEAAAAAKVKWEFRPTNMGYSFGTPLIVNTAAGWRVIVSSGYGNGSALGGDGQGYVWVLNPSTGAVEATMTTGVGSAAAPSGLAHLSKLSNTTADAVVRYVYGGDLRGNVWRFDLDAGNSAGVRVATLTDGSGNYQPITAAPTIGPVTGSTTKFYIYVGTGLYLSDEDVPGNSIVNSWATQQQTMYGIVDDTTLPPAPLINLRGTNGTTCPAGGGDGNLVCQSMSLATGSTTTYRATAHAVSLTTKKGWYIDLLPSYARVNTMAALTTTGTLVFTANVPNNVLCDPGGSSYFFALNSSTGGGVPTTYGGTTYYDIGNFLAHALASRPVIVQTAAGKRALIRMSDKSIQNPVVPEMPPCTTCGTTVPWKRIYWRPLK